MLDIPAPIEWKPLPKQEKFLEIPDTVDEALFGGAAGPGKSELIVLFPILRGWFKHPNFKGIIFRRTFPQVREELVPRSRQYYEPVGGRYNKSDHQWTFPAYGSSISFGHAENDDDIRQYDTAQFQYIGFDELTSFTEFIYTYMFSRCRSKWDELPAVIRSATNPGNIGHGWVRERFIEPYRINEETVVQGGKLLRDKTTGSTRVYIHAKLEDNPYIDTPQYRAKLANLSDEADRKAKLEGDWWTFTGQFFRSFRREPFPDEPENAQHVIPRIEIPIWWPRILSIDWGFSAMLWAGWFAIAPNRRVYLYREFAGKGLEVEDWSLEIKHLSEGEVISDLVLDWNCFESRGEDQTIAEQFRNFSGLTPRPADKGPGSRVSGALLLKEYLRWKPLKKFDPEPFSQEMADYLLDTRGLGAYKEYLNQYSDQPVNDEILPKFQIFECCPHIIKTIPLCVHAEKNPEDVEEFDGDDPYDGCRYGLRAVKRYFESTKREEKRRDKRMEAVRRLEITGDQTSFQHQPRKNIELAQRPVRVNKLNRRRRRGARFSFSS